MKTERPGVSDEQIRQDLQSFDDLITRFDRRYANINLQDHLDSLAEAAKTEPNRTIKRKLRGQIAMYRYLAEQEGVQDLGQVYTVLSRGRVATETVEDWAAAGAFSITTDVWGRGDIEGAMRTAVRLGFDRPIRTLSGNSRRRRQEKSG